MSQKTILSAKGLYTDPNLLSKVPEGALVRAENCIIDRDDVIESRRGFAGYGNTFGNGSDRAKQLLVYKDRILVHYSDKLLFNSNPHNMSVDGNFQQFDGSYTEIESGFRIKYTEANRNLFFTTNDGIKKISAKAASDFSTASGFIVDAGGAKALDVTGDLNTDTTGFLPANSKVAYRVVWGYTDNNDNVILGSPSSRLVITNYSNTSANVDLSFVIPQVVTSSYFYQIYRTEYFTAVGSLNLDDIDPGDEMNLIIEDFPTSAELSTGIVSISDITPDDFRAGGTLLYTNPNSGEGISQSNEPPPIAKDLTLYQNTLFYANTETRANISISLLGVTDLVSAVSSITIDNSVDPAQTYTFVGEKEISNISFAAYTGTIPTDIDGKYWLLNSASNNRKYYVWYDNTKTTQTLDFASYIGTIPADLNGDYVLLYTPNDRTYYVWFDSTGSTADPSTSNPALASFISVKVNISGAATKADVASAVSSTLTTNNVFNDYDVVYTATNEFLSIETESFDDTDILEQQTIQQGFSYSISTPANNDPANTPGVNTDVVGRTGIKVGVSRGVSTKAHLADATAAAILDQDNASDFSVDYTTSNEFLVITNTNNGNTDDAVDSSIDPVSNGFAISITQQGDGEDSSFNHVLLSAAATPSQQIDETARSLVNIINKNPNGSVYAFYLSGTNDLPGQLFLEARDIGTNQFSITANNASTGALFNPALPPAVGADPVEGLPEQKPNRIYFSKLQQPEAVPLVNFVNVGPEDKAISRILALRESMFILKEDGVYRLTGLNGAFTVDLFDESTKIIAPDSAVVLNNQIFCLTNQGVAVISDTGIDIISKQLDNLMQVITSSNYNYRLTSFGISYETDRSYWLFLPKTTSDNVATNALRYNTFTQTWTTNPISKTCGIVNSGDDKIYFGTGDTNYIERERKLFDRTDYADREFEISIPSDSIDGTSVTLSQSNVAEVGDALVQTQYLTINKYNQLLKKLDLDPFTGLAETTLVDFTAYSGSIPNDLNSKFFMIYSASDAKKYAVILDSTGTLTSLNPATFSELIGATQIIVDISSASSVVDIANLVQNKIKSSTLDFNITYITGQSSFTAKTVKNGETSDSFDSLVSGIGSGFSISTTVQGFGDYLSNNEAVSGDNLKLKLDALAAQLDLDPSIVATDFASSISSFSDTGSSTSSGNPTIITSLGHGIQTGRIITISNSTTSIDGTYIATKIDNDNFSIPVSTSVTGTCDWAANTSTFLDIQGMYNTIVNKLNDDDGVLYSNYSLSEGTFEFESLVEVSTVNSSTVEIEYSLKLIEGPVTIFKSIPVNLIYAPETFGDPSVSKQVSESTYIFENNTFTKATIGYRSDLSPGIETVDFDRSGKGDWGSFIWGDQNWGGGFSGVPLRTYVPRSKQRCRFIQAQYIHNSAREKWAIFGITYTFRGMSERAYRE